MKTKNNAGKQKSDENSITDRYTVTSSLSSPWPVTLHRFEAVDETQSSRIIFHSEDELFALLEECSTRTIPSKEANFLISAATFNTTNGKSESDVSHASILILDVDGADMSADDFRAIFPATKMCLFNTHSDEDNHYRVLFPLSLKVTPDAYWDMANSIIAAVQNSFFQYVDKKKILKELRKSLKHGIDRASKQIEMIYFAPSKSKDPSKSFFIVQDGITLNVLDLLYRPLHNQLLDADGNTLTEVDRPLKDMTVDEATEKQIAALKQEYKMLKPACGYRNDVFFNLAQRIWWLGVRPISRIESELIDADHDKARRKKGHIKSALKFLRKLELQGKKRA